MTDVEGFESSTEFKVLQTFVLDVVGAGDKGSETIASDKKDDESLLTLTHNQTY